PRSNPEPTSVAEFPPASGPRPGATRTRSTADAAGSQYPNPLARVKLPESDCTVTSTAPFACGGVVTVRWPSSTGVIALAAAPPNETEIALESPSPIKVVVVPPLVGPPAGSSVATLGAVT